MKTNTLIKLHQSRIIDAINQAGKDLPAAVIQLILQNIMTEVDKQVQEVLAIEAREEEKKNNEEKERSESDENQGC